MQPIITIDVLYHNILQPIVPYITIDIICLQPSQETTLLSAVHTLTGQPAATASVPATVEELTERLEECCTVAKLVSKVQKCHGDTVYMYLYFLALAHRSSLAAAQQYAASACTTSRSMVSCPACRRSRTTKCSNVGLVREVCTSTHSPMALPAALNGPGSSWLSANSLMRSSTLQPFLTTNPFDSLVMRCSASEDARSHT